MTTMDLIAEANLLLGDPAGDKADENIIDPTALTPCIIIDSKGVWHENVPVDLKGEDATDYTWMRYGKHYPVLLESAEGVRVPWYLPDEVSSESGSLLYIAQNPEGIKSTWKRKNNTIAKVNLVLLGGIVLVSLGILFVMVRG